MKKCPKCDNKEIIVIKNFEFFDVLKCNDCKYWTYQPIENCCRNPIPKCKLRITDKGQKFIYEQCENCGGRVKSSPLSFKKFGEKITGDYKTELLDIRFRKLEEEMEILTKEKHQYNITESRFAIYQNYIASDKWKEKRVLALERDNYLCQKCKIKSASDVHHLSYENLGNENLNELLSLCRECHLEIHRFE